MKLIKTIIAGVLVVGMGSALANEPVALTEAQMDNVTAGGTAVALSFGNAFGFIGAITNTWVGTSVTVQNVVLTQGGQVTQDLTISVSHADGIAL